MEDIASFNVHHDWMSPLKCKAQMPLYPKKKKKKKRSTNASNAESVNDPSLKWGIDGCLYSAKIDFSFLWHVIYIFLHHVC
jgi:hypothetical protein